MSLERLVPSLIGTNSTLADFTEILPEQCQLLGPLALIVQGLMGVLVLGSLVLKRAQEHPQRKWRVWLLDVSKQVLGQAFVHGANVWLSDLIARHKGDNPCALYFLNIGVDTTLGVFILFLILRVTTSLLLSYQPTQFRTGDYGNPPSFRIWAKQASVYVACLFLMKLVVVALFWAAPVLFTFAGWCLSWLPSDEAQVVFSMLFFPVVMNVLQFLIIDSMLKSKTLHSPLPEDADEDVRRGFLESGLSDPDDEDTDPDETAAAKHASQARRLSRDRRLSSELDAGDAEDKPPRGRGRDGTEGGGDDDEAAAAVGSSSGSTPPRGLAHHPLPLPRSRSDSYPPAPPSVSGFLPITTPQKPPVALRHEALAIIPRGARSTSISHGGGMVAEFEAGTEAETESASGWGWEKSGLGSDEDHWGIGEDGEEAAGEREEVHEVQPDLEKACGPVVLDTTRFRPGAVVGDVVL